MEPSLYSAHGQVRERGPQCLVHLARPRLCALRLLVVKVVTSDVSVSRRCQVVLTDASRVNITPGPLSSQSRRLSE